MGARLSGSPRVGVASVMQETNTFAVGASTLADFERNGLHVGESAWERMRGTNTEVAGACEELHERGTSCVPLLRAWAMSGPPLAADAFARLAELLEEQLRAAGPLDGLVLSLHGALCAEQSAAADAALLALAREVVGPDVPIGVCLDLHANVTEALLAPASFVLGYRTYPHVDQAETGRRTARLLLRTLAGAVEPVSALAKRPLLIPAETSDTSSGPLGELRAAADALERAEGVLDASVFTVQPWLDVPELGFAAVVTTDGDGGAARTAAERLADRAWAVRADFAVPLVAPAEALAQARARRDRPVLLSQSSDSPTAGSTADSAAMVRALLEHGKDLKALVTVVDASAVGACFAAGIGARVSLGVGASIDHRFHAPVSLSGVVTTLRAADPLALAGPVWAGMEVSMGRAAVMRAGSLHVLLTEQPACTFDVAPFRAVGLDPAAADVVVVRSATLFRAGFASLMQGEPLFLDLPGPSTPCFSQLDYVRAPRPLYPLEDL
jgi:microcystin degradation protein MlrC